MSQKHRTALLTGLAKTIPFGREAASERAELCAVAVEAATALGFCPLAGPRDLATGIWALAKVGNALRVREHGVAAAATVAGPFFARQDCLVQACVQWQW